MFFSANLLFPAMAALFGLLIGSFLNVCIYRIVRDQSVVAPRSYCPNCLKSIEWFDNIPVFSYVVLLHGRCRSCREPISMRYPLVEVLTAILFALAAGRYGLHLAALKWCVFEALLVALSFTDLEERLLPDELTIGGALAGLVFAFVVPVTGPISELLLPHARPIFQSAFEVVVGSFFITGPVWALAAFWSRLRGREMMGMGDVKLLPLMGAFLGLEQGITALLIGSISGVVIGGSYILITRQKAGSYELPLGTFFCLGAGIVPLINSI